MSSLTKIWRSGFIFLLWLEFSCAHPEADGLLSCGQLEYSHAKELSTGLMLLTGFDLKPFQTRFCLPELADPYLTVLPDSVVISGTGPYHLKFKAIDDLQKGEKFQIVWNRFFYSDGTPMENWDLKPALWVQGPLRLWDPAKDKEKPQVVWYGGHMRSPLGAKAAHWPDDHWSRDVFAFQEKEPGRWLSLDDSVFSRSRQWPRSAGSFLGHRYGHQMVMIPKKGKSVQPEFVPAVFYEQVTQVRGDGSPAVTEIFMDEMASPFEARGKPVALVSPINPATGQPFPSAIRENGALLVEGPLYFRFSFEGDLWEAIGFSSGSFYGNYPAVFASRKISDGLQGKPFQIDLNEDGKDFHDAGKALGKFLHLAGGPGRPAVLIGPDGMAIPSSRGKDLLQVLVHAYRKDILPVYRVLIQADLKVERGKGGVLRFELLAPGSRINSPSGLAEIPGKKGFPLSRRLLADTL